MVSDFLTPGGRLTCTKDDGSVVFATHFHEYSKDNYWTGDLMVKHTLEGMLPIFEAAFPSDKHQGLFLFDNATNHCVMADDALVAKGMNLSRGGRQPLMRDGFNPLTNEPQQMWQWEESKQVPKGIKVVLKERGLWPLDDSRFKLECATKGDHRDDQQCCARRLLASQPDFKIQKGVLAEELEKRGHLVMFYPKFHPELDFIEYYWGELQSGMRVNTANTTWLVFA